MERYTFSDNHPWAQLGLTLLICLCCFIIFLFLGSIAAIPLFGIHPADLTLEFSNLNNIALQKYLQIVQAIGLFIVPSLLLGRLFMGSSIQYLKLNHIPSFEKFILVVVIMITAIPVINLLAELNSKIHLPAFMAGAQQYVDRTSKLYEQVTESFMKTSTLQGLSLNILVMAIIPAFGEEFLFRGILQRIFSNWTRNVHWGILISALIFSAVHLEFYGFFPRWALGIMFGYLLFWSGSIWLPITAHFVNNAMDVTLYYLINHGAADKKMAVIGSNTDVLPYTLLCSVIMGGTLYFLYKRRRV